MDSIKPGEKISLDLTADERAVLLETLTAVPAGLREAIQDASAESIMFTFDELDDLARYVAFAADRAKGKTVKRTLDIVSGRIQHQILSYMNSQPIRLSKSEGSRKQKPNGKSKTPTKSVKPGLLYQFKITLLRIEPPIWRRIQIKDCTLDKLHEHIQTAMGWTNSHLHQFKVGGETYGNPELLEDDFDCLDSTRTKFSTILPTDGKPFSFQYEYDFGDCWEHEVLFEGCPPVDPKAKYPLCLEGERACPPEDCGGARGYADFLEAIGDKGHKQHDEMLEWIGGSFDPAAFDPETATANMKNGLPDWRESEDDDWLWYGE